MRLLSLLCLIFTLTLAARAENWPQWRGPAHNGSTTEAALPEALDTGKNLAWSTTLPGPGAATPVVWDNHVFVSGMDKDSKKLQAIAIDRASGKILWKHDCGEGMRTTHTSDLTSPSAVTDGKTVIFYFGSGDLVCYDFAGKQIWARSIEKDHGKFNMLWLYGSSPLLFNGKLYIQVLHRNVPADQWRDPKDGDKLADSYLLIVDPATGKDLAKTVRPNNAKIESQESYGTPIPWVGKERTEILLVGGDCVTGHDPETGKELWRAGGWNPEFVTHWRIVPSVAVAGDLAIVCAPKTGPVLAYRPGAVEGNRLAWQTREATSDVSVPLFYKGNLYVLNGDNKKSLTCLDPATGKARWTLTLESRAVFRSSPTGADNKIYFINEAGEAFVVSADGPKLLHLSKLDSGRTRASIAAAQGMVFVRTGEKLHAFRK